MKLGPIPKPLSPAGGHSMKGMKRASPSSDCNRNTRPLAISSALVTGGSRENIGGLAGKRSAMIPGAVEGPVSDGASARRHAPQRGVELILAARHAHAAVHHRHAFRLQSLRLLAMPLRTA